MTRLLAVVLLGAVAPAAFAGAQRVVTLAPHLAELACAAGGCERLVGVVAYTDYPPEVLRVPQVGNAFAVSIEQVLALRPDLVLAWDGGTPPETAERLRALGLRVEAVAVRRLEEVAAALVAVGGWLGTDAVARPAADAYRRGLAALRRRHAQAAPLRVLYQIESNPLFSINRDSPISQAIELCGGINVFADLPALAAAVNREAVLAADPEAIVFGRQDPAAEEIRAGWTRTAPVSAARRGALYAIDANRLERATPRLLDGIGELCAALSDARARRAAATPRSAPLSSVPAPASAP